MIDSGIIYDEIKDPTIIVKIGSKDTNTNNF